LFLGGSHMQGVWVWFGSGGKLGNPWFSCFFP
jgi:hypothetical protein